MTDIRQFIFSCPFCLDDMSDMGDADDDLYFAKSNRGELSVNCSNCYATGPSAKTREEAILLWNTRPE